MIIAYPLQLTSTAQVSNNAAQAPRNTSGNFLCEHKRQHSGCKDCGGSGICQMGGTQHVRIACKASSRKRQLTLKSNGQRKEYQGLG